MPGNISSTAAGRLVRRTTDSTWRPRKLRLGELTAKREASLLKSVHHLLDRHQQPFIHRDAEPMRVGELRRRILRASTTCSSAMSRISSTSTRIVCQGVIGEKYVAGAHSSASVTRSTCCGHPVRRHPGSASEWLAARAVSPDPAERRTGGQVGVLLGGEPHVRAVFPAWKRVPARPSCHPADCARPPAAARRRPGPSTGTRP